MIPIEFNRVMTELEGEVKNPISDYEKFFASLPPLDYYSDLNLLMPLAWKHKIDIEVSILIPTISYWRDKKKIMYTTKTKTP